MEPEYNLSRQANLVENRNRKAMRLVYQFSELFGKTVDR